MNLIYTHSPTPMLLCLSIAARRRDAFCYPQISWKKAEDEIYQ